jgi:periplasmic protein TonB
MIANVRVIDSDAPRPSGDAAFEASCPLAPALVRSSRRFDTRLPRRVAAPAAAPALTHDPPGSPRRREVECLAAVIRPSSTPLRARLVGASAALHVAVFVMAGRPGPAPAGEATMVDVTVEEPPASLDEPVASVAATEDNVPRAAPPRPATADRAAGTQSSPRRPSRRDAPTASASAPQAETTSAPARFALVVSNLPSSAGGIVSARGDSSGSRAAADETPLAEGDVSSPARLTGSLSPAYPPAARAQDVEADVVMSIVVGSTGRVTDVRIARAAGYGFDDAALRAVREARFVPARRQGRPVAVRMRWTVTFRLR